MAGAGGGQRKAQGQQAVVASAMSPLLSVEPCRHELVEPAACPPVRRLLLLLLVVFRAGTATT